MLDYFFYGLCLALLGLAGVTVLARNLFRASMGLLGVLLCTAVLFLLLRAEMVALVQIMVYIGGIMIFVLYAVLLTSDLGGKMPHPSLLKAFAGLTVATTVFLFLLGLANSTQGGPSTLPMGEISTFRDIASLRTLGLRMLDPGPKGFLVSFELISVLLLASMVGAIALAMRAPKSQEDKKT